MNKKFFYLFSFLLLVGIFGFINQAHALLFYDINHAYPDFGGYSLGDGNEGITINWYNVPNSSHSKSEYMYAEVNFSLTDGVYYGDECASGSGLKQIFITPNGSNYGLPAGFNVEKVTTFNNGNGSAILQTLKISVTDATLLLGRYEIHTDIESTTPFNCTYRQLNFASNVTTPIYLGYPTIWNGDSGANYFPEISPFSPNNNFPLTNIRFGGTAVVNSVDISDYVNIDLSSSTVLDIIDHSPSSGFYPHMKPDLVNNPLNFSNSLHKITDSVWQTFYFNGLGIPIPPVDNTHDIGQFSVKCDMCITLTPTPTTITEGLTQIFSISKYNGDIVNLSTGRVKMYAGDCINITCTNPIPLGSTEKFVVQSISSGSSSVGTVTLKANVGEGLINGEKYTIEIGSNDANFYSESFYPRAKSLITVITVPQSIYLVGDQDILLDIGDTKFVTYTANVTNINQVDWFSNIGDIDVSSSLIDAGLNASRSPASDASSPFTTVLTLDGALVPATGTITLYAQDTDGTPTVQKIINVTIRGRDLTTGAVSPTSATVYVPQDFSAVITNIGEASTTGSFPYIFQRAGIDGTGTVTTLLPYGTVTQILVPGEVPSTTVTKSITFDSTGTSYSLRVCADKSSASGGGTQTELDENNNCGPWTNIAVSQVPVVTLTASQNPVDYNTSTTLSWYASGATGCNPMTWTNTSGGSGSIPIASVSGSVSSPNLTSATTFSLTCSGAGGSATKTVAVNIIPTVNLTATPTDISAGGGSLLAWNSTNATSCSASWTTSTTTSGTMTVFPTLSSTNYSISCVGLGTATTPAVVDTVMVTIKPTLTLTATPNVVSYGGSTTLTWDSTYATSCIASGAWSGSRGLDSNPEIPVTFNGLTSAKTYTLTCTGPSPTPVVASVTVNIIPTVSLTATPYNIVSGGQSQLNWTSTNADSCTSLDFDTGGRTSSELGSVPVSPTVTTTYHIVCSKTGVGTGNDEVNVVVDGLGIGMTGWLTTNPTSCEIASGASTCSVGFNWNVTNPENPGGSAVTSPSYPLGMGALFTNHDSGLNVSHTVPFGLSNYYLYNNAKLLDQTGVNASCVSTAGWDGTKCVALPTVTFSANPTLIAYGGSTTLTWVTNNATSCLASSEPVNSSWNGAKPSANGSHSGNLTLFNSTNFTITCSNAIGSSTKSVNVGVGAPPTMTGTLTPATSTCEIPSGASSCGNTLTWTTTNPQATSSITSKYGTPSPVNGNNGSQLFTVHSIGDTWFFLYNNSIELAQSVITANCVSGNYWDGTKCVVALGYPTVDISASPNPIDSGQESFLTWTSTGADTCTASGDWSGAKPLQKLPPGSGTGLLTSTKTYNLTCTNTIGIATDSVTVEVNSLEMTGTLTVEPTCVIPVNQSTCSVNVDWKVKNPQNVGGSEVTSNWPSPNTVVGSGDSGATSATIPYSFRRFFLYNNSVLLAQGIANASCAMDTYWNPENNKCIYFAPTVNLTASPKSVLPGESSTLSWSSTRATSCTASDGWTGPRSPEGGTESTGPLNSTKKYTLTCTGLGGSISDPATVTVTTTTADKQPIFIED